MKSKQTHSTKLSRRRVNAGRRIRGFLGLYLILALLAVGATHRDQAGFWMARLHAVGLPESGAELAEVLRVAEGLEGRPYLYGGSDEDGFDCSGFTYYVYGRAGYRIPRTVREQFHGLVSISQPRPGDLVFFSLEPAEKTGASNAGDGATHVGIYAGGGRFIHAPRTGGKVRVESMETPYWQSRLRGSRTVIVPDLTDTDFSED